MSHVHSPNGWVFNDDFGENLLHYNGTTLYVVYMESIFWWKFIVYNRSSLNLGYATAGIVFVVNNLVHHPNQGACVMVWWTTICKATRSKPAWSAPVSEACITNSYIVLVSLLPGLTISLQSISFLFFCSD